MISRVNSGRRRRKLPIRIKLRCLKLLLAAPLLMFLAVLLRFHSRHNIEYNTYTNKIKNIINIPQIIWQTAKSHNPPPAARKVMNTWKVKNPLSRWKRELLDDDELLTFIKRHFDQRVVDAFIKLPLPVMRTDFFRVAVMLHEGGIYADVDVECIEPIQKWDNGAIHRCSVIIGMENDHHICNWGFASQQGHLLFQKAVDLSISRFVDAEIDLNQDHFVHFVTGPAMLTHALGAVIHDFGGCDGVPASKMDAKKMYDLCRVKLREKHGICLYDQETLNGWFRNHYSSQREDLQSENWLSSWTLMRNETNAVKN